MPRLSSLALLLPLLACRATPGAEALSHGVFFTLADPGDRAALVADCAALVAATDGVLAHAVGPRVEDLARPVNDQAFDVGLWILFADHAAHDAYQVSPAHLHLIERWGDRLAGARVFDHAGRGTEDGR